MGVIIGCTILGLIGGFFIGGIIVTNVYKKEIRSGDVQIGKDTYGTYKYRTEP